MRMIALLAALPAIAAPQLLPRATEQTVAAVECRLTADEAWREIDRLGYHRNNLDRTARTGLGDARTRGVRPFGMAGTAIHMQFSNEGNPGARPHFAITTTVAARFQPARDTVLARFQRPCDATIPLAGGLSACRLDMRSSNPGHPLSLTITPTGLRTNLTCAYLP